MRIKRIVVGLAAVAAVAGLAACSSASAGEARVTAAADTSSVVETSTSDPTTTTSAAATTTTTTTTKAPTRTVTTTKSPVTTKKAVATQAATQAPGVPCSAAAKACVDLSAHRAWLLSNGKVIYGPVSIMPGRPGWRTPTGTFHVLFKNAHYFSTEFKVPMPDSVFFYPGIAFHVGSLQVASHGCVHLSVTSALKFFNTLKVGDMVQVLS